LSTNRSPNSRAAAAVAVVTRRGASAAVAAEAIKKVAMTAAAAVAAITGIINLIIDTSLFLKSFLRAERIFCFIFFSGKNCVRSFVAKIFCLYL
jgi:hypothetical protein